MKKGDALKRGMHDVADAVRRVAQEARTGSDAGSHINVSRRTNIRVARNIGNDGGTANAFAIQDASLEQDGVAATGKGTETVGPRNHE
jgi:carbamoylphosphate synthase large subunit